MQPATLSYVFLTGFLSAIFCLQWWQEPSYDPLWPFLIGNIFSFCILSVFIRSFRFFGLLLLAFFLGVSCAFLRVAQTTHEPSPDTIDSYASGSYVEVTGIIIAEPDRRPLQTKYTIESEQIEFFGSGALIKSVNGKILVTDKRQWPEFQYGDSVVARGTLEKPGKIETFHYDRYLSRYDIYAVMYRGSIRYKSVASADVTPSLLRDESWQHSLFSKLFTIKSSFESQINRLLPEPHASFMAGLLTGSRRGIPEHLLQDFNTTGLTHIIAISGYNITIVITVISGLLFWLPLRWRFIPAVTAIVAFTLFVGASAAVVRAAIMGILGLLALQAQRQSEVRLTILWTLAFMLCWNPKYLWYDAGFQLSFLAVLGLTELAPLLDKWFTRIPSVLGMREALQMTIAAQLSAVPLIVHLFGRLSLVAPLANLVVAPMIPLAMLFGFVGTIVSFFVFPIGLLIMFIGWGCLEWIVIWTKWLSAIPLASITLPNIHTALITAYYFVVLIILWKHQRTTVQLQSAMNQ